MDEELREERKNEERRTIFHFPTPRLVPFSGVMTSTCIGSLRYSMRTFFFSFSPAMLLLLLVASSVGVASAFSDAGFNNLFVTSAKKVDR